MTRLATLAALALVLAAPAAAQCTTSWTNAAGGDWNDAANWSAAAVPGPTDDACIDLAGTYTVSLTSGAAASVNSLSLGGPSGTQTLTSTLALTIAAASTIGANGVWQWSNGYLQGGATMTNNGLVIVDGSPIGAARGISDLGSVLNNLATIRWESDEVYLRDDGALENAGTIEVNQTSGATAELEQTGSTTGSRLFTNTGTIDVQAGTFNLRGDSRHDGATLEVAAGATMEFGANTHAFAGTLTGTPAGDLLLTTEITAEPGAEWALAGTGFQWRIGFLTGGETLTNTGLTVLNGAPIGAARGVSDLGTVFSNTGTVRWETDEFYLRDDGALENAGTIVVDNTAGATPTSRQTGSTTGSRLFTNTGTLDVQAGTMEVRGDSRHDGATLEVAAGATLDFTVNTHTFAGTTSGTPAGDLEVHASLVAEAGAVWDVGGTGIQWQTGFLTGGETLTNTGLTVFNGAPIGAARGVSDAGTTFANTGTIEWGSDEVYLRDSGSLTNAGTINGITNGGQISRLNRNGSGVRLFTNTGTIHVQTGSLELETDARHDGATISVDAGAELGLDNGLHTFAGTTSGTADGDLLVTTDLAAEAGAVVDIGGAGIQWRTGFLTGGETLTNTGRIEFNGSPIGAARGVSDLGTVLDNQGHIQWTSDEVYLRDDGAMTNAGTMTVLRDGNVTRFGLTGSGAARIFTNAGTVSVDTTTTFDVNVPFVHEAGALIAGGGTLDLAGSAFTHDGDTGPGLSPGILTWDGAPWNAPATGALFIEIGGTTVGDDYDQLAVDDAAALDGTLEIDVTSTAGLTVGDTFTILTATGGVSGTFASIALDGVPGPTFSVAYNANDVVLTLDALESPLTLRGQAGWRTLATPFPDLPLGGRTFGMVETLYTAGYLGADRDQRNARGTANVFLYDESTGLFEPPADAGPVGGGVGFWIYVFNDDDSFTPGTQGGFPKPLQSSGTPAAFPFDLPVTYTPAVVRGPETPALGINLVGNPANEDIDWDQLTRTNVSDVLYIYDRKLNGGDGGWRTWNGTTGTLPTGGLIPVGQGFHVEATDASPQLTVPPAALLGTQSSLYRLTEAGDDAPQTARKGTDEEAPTPRLRLRLDAAVGGEARRAEAFVSFEPEGALGFDARDARLLAAAPGATAARLYTTLGEAHGDHAGTALEIAAMPAPEGAIQLDLGAEALLAGEAADADAVLSWEAVALPEAWTATLLDRLTGETYDLTAAGSAAVALAAEEARTVTEADAGAAHAEVQAAIDAAVALGEAPPTPRSPQARALRALAPPGGLKSDPTTRFAIEIDPLGVLAGATEATLGAVYPNPAGREARVDLTLVEATEVRVDVFDVLGRRVMAVHDGRLPAGVHPLAVPVGALAPGTYVLRVDGSGLGQSRRLTVAR